MMMEEDYCVHIKCSNIGFIILSLYVDGILIVGNYKKLIDVTKKRLSSNFEMKDIDEANYVLGVKTFRDSSKRLLGLSHEIYIKKMLKCYHMHDCETLDTFVEKNLSLSFDMCPKTPNEKEQMSEVPYASVVGSLMYAMMCTRLDICYAVGLVRRFQSNPGPKPLDDSEENIEISERNIRLCYVLPREGSVLSWIYKFCLGRRS